MDPAPFLRGNPYPPTRRDPYPRAKPGDPRLPADTWFRATVPIGVRLEFIGDASEIEIGYERKEPDEHESWQTPAFELWRDDVLVSSAGAPGLEGRVRLAFGGGRAVVYIPERAFPRIVSVDAMGGSIEPAPAEPRWICYGDSIAAGARASTPALSWTAIAARRHDLDLVNMGYSGAARGELASAEHIAELDADVISLTHGTNCWNRVPHTAGLMRESMRAFLTLVRRGHLDTPLVVCTPPLRPEAEDETNELGATLPDLRAAMAEACDGFDVVVVDGRDLIDASMLADNVHPNDAGHRAIADAIGPVIAKAAG